MALTEEEFSDGVLSAIDLDMTMERQADPSSGRVKIGMTGKFLPFRYYGPRAMSRRWDTRRE